MQTTLLPSLNASAAPTGAPQAAPGTDGSQFGAALSREVGQRNAVAQPRHEDSASKAPPQPQAQQQPQAPQQDAAAPQQASAINTAGARPATGKDQASGKDQDQDQDKQDAAAASAAGAPATDMLAIVAGVAELLQRQGATAPVAAPAAGAGQGTGAAVGASADGARLAGAPATGGADVAAPALPADAAARFAALLRTGQGAGATGATAAATAGVHADSKAAARGTSLATAQDPSLAPTGAPGAPSLAPSAAPAALAAQLAAAVPHESKAATPDQAAAQLMAATQAAQQAAPAMAQVQALAAENHIPAQLGTPAWDNQVGQKIVWMAAGGEQSASLTLNPPDLGPMQVVLSVNGDQASVAFSSSHQDVRHALESALPRLREMMGESGIALGSATVSAGMPDGRQAQDNWQGSGQPGSRPGPGPVAGSDEPVAARASTRTTIIGDRGMVDTFA